LAVKFGSQIGCLEYCKDNNHGEAYCKDECSSHTNNERLDDILEMMDSKLDTCKSESFAIEYVSNWIDENIGDESTSETANKIFNMVEDKFSHLKATVAAYEAEWPGTFNFDLHKFEHHGKDIVVELVSSGYSSNCVCPRWNWTRKCDGHRFGSTRQTFEKYRGKRMMNGRPKYHAVASFRKSHPSDDYGFRCRDCCPVAKDSYKYKFGNYRYVSILV